MRVNTTCTCNACRNMGQLDLKFFLHHGVYATQEIAGRIELQGPEVIRLHRLMKNSVTAATGIRAYALVTEQATEAIGLPDFFASAVRHVEPSGEFGDTVCFIYDLAPIFARWRASRRVIVERNEALAFEPMECDLPVPPMTAWAYVTDVEKKIRWQHGIDNMAMTGLLRGRIGPGATQHCAHGKETTLHDIVDWRPFDYVTWQIRLPMGAVVRQTAEFAPIEGGATHLSLRTAKPQAGNPLTTALVRTVTRLVNVKKLVSDQRASKDALERLAGEELSSSKTREPAL